MKIKETQSTAETNPDNYVGYEVDEKDGKRKKKDKDMSDKELHAQEPPDGPKPPAINVQAEAYKPGFSIGLLSEEKLDISDEMLEAFKAFPLKALNYIHHVSETYPQTKLVFEDTVTGEKGYVTPAMFVKVYSKMLQDSNDKKEQPTTMSEDTKPSKAANLPLANELMAVGLVNNVKGTAKVLREENPMRKAMEIFYASEKTNANTDEKKAEYVPSQLKEGKMVLGNKTVAAPEEKEPVVETKKKRPVIW